MFLRPTPHPQRFQGPSCVIMWVLGLHKVHGEESIVVLLVHGELILLLFASSIGSSWFPSCHFINQLVHLFSFLFTLSLITSFFIWRTIPPLEQGSLQSQISLLTLTTNRVIPLLGSPFFPQSLTLRLFLRVDISSASDSSIL
ncbi:unnamed protein product [Microthlaspi erraticum]|uniref:Uncharacterized protein n=1 Tax=Microthlaspi erraticum TaxID=1685480 RepID=A0A6D2I0K1_9BRAS|nr:unnamed protein product [Microthlaspi erraticum]